MQTYFQFLATYACSIFSGAALYVSLVEHPARMSCGVVLAITEWVPSYKRAAIMQASLAILGSVFAFLAWNFGANILWLIGGFIFILVVPYTLIVMMPTNKGLLSPDLDKSAESTYQLLKKWNRLHLVRVLLSSIALIIFLFNINQV